MKRAEIEKLIEGLDRDPGCRIRQVIESTQLISHQWSATPAIHEMEVHPYSTGLCRLRLLGVTCTAGKNEDMDMTHPFLADALKQGNDSNHVEFSDPVRFSETAGVLIAELSLRFSTVRRTRHRAHCGA